MEKPFTTDCCCAHDFAYWRGGNNRDRSAADKALRLCVAGKGYRLWAWVMWVAVRLCGGSHFLFHGDHRWGWGVITNIERIVLRAGESNSVEEAVISVEEIAGTIQEAITGAEKRAAAVTQAKYRLRKPR